jgi:hypothetical protein
LPTARPCDDTRPARGGAHARRQHIGTQHVIVANVDDVEFEQAMASKCPSSKRVDSIRVSVPQQRKPAAPTDDLDNGIPTSPRNKKQPRTALLQRTAEAHPTKGATSSP